VAAVTVLMGGTAPPTGAHRKVTLLSASAGMVTAVAESLIVPSVDPAVSFGDMADNWVQVPRPGRKPLLRWLGQKLATIQLSLTIDDVQTINGNADAALAYLAQWARTNASLQLAYGPFEAVGFYSITSFVPKSVLREQGTNRITRATVDMTLTENPEGSAIQTVPPPTTSSATSVSTGQPQPAKTTSTASSRSYVVVAGDSLWSISVRFYGIGTYWRRIADANGVTDVRTIRPGQRLIIP
jgi:nucleoid-associated protein YgaU